jgi:plasmid rolling circle replication initiator protein Rep
LSKGFEKPMRNCTQKLPILEEVEFQEHKILTLDIIDKYQYFNKNKAQNMIDCGQRLQFGLYENIQTLEQQKHLEEMYTCKDRFCSFCNWRRARKLGIQSYEVLKAIESENKVRYIFATFTVRNCHINDLSDTIKLMNKAFDRMFKTKRIKNSIFGFIRALEYPPQKDNQEYMHPHFHCLFVVPVKYFNIEHDLYIKQEEWINMWQKALRVDYAPSVDIRVVKREKGNAIAKIVAETIKYPLKTMDLKSMSVDLFQELVHQMKFKRALAFGGIVKEYRKKLILDDVEDGDLIYDGVENEEIWKRLKTLLYEFKNGDYGLQYYEKG